MEKKSKPEVDDIIDGYRNGFIHNPTRNTRKDIEEYLESIMPGKWDEWNVRATKVSWDREDRIMRNLEGRE